MIHRAHIESGADTRFSRERPIFTRNSGARALPVYVTLRDFESRFGRFKETRATSSLALDPFSISSGASSPTIRISIEGISGRRYYRIAMKSWRLKLD